MGGVPIALDEVDANGFGLARLGVDTHFEADGDILCNLIALAQCSDMEKNVGAAIVWLDEAESSFLVKHFDFSGRHRGPSFWVVKL
jgi:hypothetical protein